MVLYILITMRRKVYYLLILIRGKKMGRKKHYTTNYTMDDFPEIKEKFVDIDKEANYRAVARAIETGKLLLEMKSYIPSGQWMIFVKQNLKMSLRTCQDYMKIASSDIDESLWNLGINELLSRVFPKKK
jgi:hypothetical protein